MTLRVEVDRFDAGVRRTMVAYVPSVDEIPADVVAVLDPLVRRHVDELAVRLDLHREDAALLLVAELTERKVDADAYDREAARRGVLPL